MAIILLILLTCEGLLWLIYNIGFALSIIIPIFWACAEIACRFTDKIQTFKGFSWLLAGYFFWVFFIACFSYYLKGSFEL